MNVHNLQEDNDSNQSSISKFLQTDNYRKNLNRINNSILLNDQSYQKLQSELGLQNASQEISKVNVNTSATATIREPNKRAQNQVNLKIIGLQNINPKNSNPQYGKNSAKQLGNYLRKHIMKRNLTHLPQLQNFVNKKQRNRQSNYTLKDWRDMLRNDNEHQTECREIVKEYLKNWAYIDILLEYKQQNEIDMIEHIEHFISGCKNPARLICNRR